MKEKPATPDDVIVVALIFFVILLIFNAMDSCSSRQRYHDLRDRLERLEQR